MNQKHRPKGKPKAAKSVLRLPDLELCEGCRSQ
jgi:hypothetical protein